MALGVLGLCCVIYGSRYSMALGVLGLWVFYGSGVLGL